jgi:hypothetical protein
VDAGLKGATLAVFGIEIPDSQLRQRLDFGDLGLFARIGSEELQGFAPRYSSIGSRLGLLRV